MLQSDYQICPGFKSKLDKALMLYRERHALRDGARKYVAIIYFPIICDIKLGNAIC